MAIDDNASYELTGYQVKDLAGKIRAKADASSLASVATSGLYSDLTGAPTIPTVYNGTLTIQQNGTQLGTFSANQSTNETINITGGGVITTFHWGGSPNYSMYKDSGYTTPATYSDIATAYADGLVYIADGEDETTYVMVSDIPDANTITVTGIGLPGNDGGSNSYTYASSTWTKAATQFQTKLTAGTNIQINGSTISATDTTYSNFVGATSSVAGAAGLVPAPAAGDDGKALHGDGTWKDTTAKLVEMSYGESNAWAKFIAAYNAGSIVYCRASSNANPGTGSQTRKAFMAYVNNATSPTSVEFQYVRSQSSKTASQQCDQVFVYTLTNSNGGTWSVASRDMAPKIVAGTGMSSTFTTGANATITLNAEPDYSTSEVDTKVKWIDGKTIYRKTIDFGALPNATGKTVAHGISGLAKVIKMEGYAKNSNNVFQMLPYVPTHSGYLTNVHTDLTNIEMQSVGDLSGYTECYITLYYTKSS